MTANPDFDPMPILKKIDKALSYPLATYNFDMIVQSLKDGHMQIFWNEDACIITEICVSPVRKFLNVFLAAGKLKALYKLQPQIVAFARKNQLSQAQGTMQHPKWGAVLQKRGWIKQAEIWALPPDKWE